MKVKILPPQDIVTVDIDKDINVKVKPTINVEIVNSNKEKLNFKLNMRKALNGDLMIFDHKDIDIIVMTEKKKVVAFAKDLMSEVVYGAESRLMEHLRKSGIIEYDSIQGGNIYGSMEAVVLDSKKISPMKFALLHISEWCKSEKPSGEFLDAHDDMMSNYVTDPGDEHATELGEVPHEEEKGSILTKNLFAPYLYGRYTY